MLGWTSWIVAALFPISTDIVKSNGIGEFLLFLNALFGLIGGIFYTWGFYRYFKIIHFKILELFLVISILVSFSLYFLTNYRLAIQFSSLLLNSLIFVVYLFPIFSIKDLKIFLGKSKLWYYITFVSLLIFIPFSIMASLEGYNYGLYEAENTLIIILYYVPTISSSILFIILLVHLEYTLSTHQKRDLKDKFSHNLGNIVQVIIAASELIEKNTNLKEQEKINLDLIQTKSRESAKLIKEIREL
jgi:hypothetical protein